MRQGASTSAADPAAACSAISGQQKATFQTDERTDPDEINIRWMWQGPEGSSDEWVDCPATTTVLRVAKNGSDVISTCVRRLGMPSPNR